MIPATKTSQIRLLDFSVYVVFLISATLLAMSVNEINMIYLKQVIERLFLTHLSYNEYGLRLTFNDIITVDDWWLFMKSTFAENIARLSLKNDSTLSGLGFVTPPRLRQLRVRNGTCTINVAFRNLFSTCYGDYSSENEDFNNFHNGTHMKASELSSSPLGGMVATYEGGGYVERFSLDVEENKRTLENLESKNWIDRGTRAVVIEFALFNAYTNWFCNIKLLTEFPSTEAILVSHTLSPLKYSIMGSGVFLYISALLFYGSIIYYTFHLMASLIKTELSPAQNFIWKVLDLIIILLGYIILVYIVWHILYLKTILKTDKVENHNFNLDIICQWYTYFTFTVGLSIFLVWIKLLKYASFQQFSKTLQKSVYDLLGFAIMFSIIFVAYANLSVLLFGSRLESFRNFRNAFISTIRMVLCDFNYTEVEEEYPILAPVFFLSYILLVLFILMNMFLAILYDTYSELKGELKSGKPSTTKNDILFMYEKVKVIFSRRAGNSTNTSADGSKYSEKLDKTTEMLKREEIAILSSCFEILVDKGSQEDLQILRKRIQILEKSLNVLLLKADDIIRKGEKASVTV